MLASYSLSQVLVLFNFLFYFVLFIFLGGVGVGGSCVDVCAFGAAVFGI